MRLLSDLAGTLRTAFRVGRSALDASGLSAARTHALPNKSGTIALLDDLDDLEGQIGGKMTNPMTTAGDLIVGGTAGAPTRLGGGSEGQVLTRVGGTPAWANSAAPNPKQLCTAWVNFNGTGTVTIRDSYNVSSITDNGTGDYTVNFATPMANTNYSASFSGQDGAGGAFTIGLFGGQWNTSGVRFAHRTASTLFDSPILVCQVFGGKA